MPSLDIPSSWIVVIIQEQNYENYARTKKTRIVHPHFRWHCCVVQSLSHAQLFVTPWSAARQASLPFTISGSLLKLMSIE